MQEIRDRILSALSPNFNAEQLAMTDENNDGSEKNGRRCLKGG